QGVSLQEEKRSYIARSSGKSSRFKLSYWLSILVLTSVVKIQNWHRFNGWFVLWYGGFGVN
ncbi:hypothetical protein, partial [Vibrio parahaemolyticus]|uniref:hypothetical protein n=1 Tax=Vibrio parahaemolyticus TaxID=670 RepID=UPI001E2C3DC8